MADAPRVAASNEAAFRAWDGYDGQFWADHDDRFDTSMAGYHRLLLDAARIGPAERVLDVGCGTGQVTRDAARLAPNAAALGVDLSARMIERARERAAEQGVVNARFLQADAQVHPFEPATFDVAVSRAGSMFFGDPLAAFTNVGLALRPGGRLVLLVWRRTGDSWVAEISAALAVGRPLPTPPAGAPGPFSLADPDHTRSLLTGAGFGDISLDAVSAPMQIGQSADDAYRFVEEFGFTRYMLTDLDPDGRRRALEALRANIDAHESPAGVLYPSAGWIVRATWPAGTG